MVYKQYTTIEGERWDNVAWKAYGNAAKVNEIIASNPDVQITDRIPAGTVLNIPIVEEEEVLTDLELLPPWKQ